MDQVITIGRLYGCGGTEVGKRVAKELDIPFYDGAFIEETAAKRSGIHLDLFQNAEQKGTSSYAYEMSLGGKFSMPVQDQVYLAQREAILYLASQEPCVIVGRSANEILYGEVPVLRVYLFCALEKRLQRAREEYKIETANLEKYVKAMDKRRATYYNFYEGKKKELTEQFDLCLDSGFFGIEKTAKLIVEAYRN